MPRKTTLGVFGWHALRYSEGRAHSRVLSTPFGVPQGMPPNASNVLASCLALKPFQFRLLGDGELAEFGRFRRQVRLAAGPHTTGFGGASVAAPRLGLLETVLLLWP